MAKRIKVSSTGQLHRRKATRAHKLTIKSASRKRAYTLEHDVSKGDRKNIKKMLGL